MRLHDKLLWRGKASNSHTWLYGYLFQDNLTGEKAILKKQTWDENISMADVLVDEKTISRYSMFQDDAGEKIFEGDVIGNKDGYRYLVKRRRGEWWLYDVNNIQEDNAISIIGLKESPSVRIRVYVIGNIFDDDINNFITNKL